jgi:AcrR family transcriptional regulator
MKLGEFPSQVDVRGAILDAAERLLARYGYRKSTMEDLALEAGIGKGTTYLHFESKEEVFLGTVDRIVERLLEALGRLARSPGSAAGRLREMLLLRVLLRFDAVQAYPNSLDGLFAALRPQLLARRQRYFRQEAETLAEVLEQGRAAGELRFDGAAQTAAALLEATNSLLPYGLSAAELGARDELRKRAERIADLLVRGLRP